MRSSCLPCCRRRSSSAVGGISPARCDVAWSPPPTATLAQDVASGGSREDLYYRLTSCVYQPAAPAARAARGHPFLPSTSSPVSNDRPQKQVPGHRARGECSGPGGVLQLVPATSASSRTYGANDPVSPTDPRDPPRGLPPELLQPFGAPPSLPATTAVASNRQPGASESRAAGASGGFVRQGADAAPAATAPSSATSLKRRARRDRAGRARLHPLALYATLRQLHPALAAEISRKSLQTTIKEFGLRASNRQERLIRRPDPTPHRIASVVLSVAPLL